MKQCFRPQRLLRLLVLVLISLFAGVSLYQWNASTLTGNEMPMPFGVGVSVVLSGSMEPQLQVNDLVLVQRQEEYVPGDVVVYQSGRSLVIHQLLEIDSERAVTKGIANNAPDPAILPQDIMGKQVFRIPLLGGLVRFFKSPAGFVLLLAAAVVLFELPYRKEKTEAVRQQEAIKEEIRKLREETDTEA